MIPDMTPLFYIVFIAIGGVIGLALSILLWIGSFFTPIPSAVLLFLPVAGALIGFVYATSSDK